MGLRLRSHVISTNYVMPGTLFPPVRLPCLCPSEPLMFYEAQHSVSSTLFAH